jgi:hypothetical protein
MGHESTLNLTHSSTPLLYHLYITSSPPGQTPNWTHQSQKHMYWLTRRHSSNSRDVPLIDVSVEGGSIHEHCRKTKKADYIHSQRARIKDSWTLIRILRQRKEGKHSSNYIHHSTNPNPERTSLNHNSMLRSRYVILKHTYRLDVMHADDTNQITSTQTFLSPNALAVSPTTVTQLTFIPGNESPNLHTQNHATFNNPSCTLYLPHPTTSASPPSVHYTIKKKIRQAKSVKSHQDIS